MVSVCALPGTTCMCFTWAVHVRVYAWPVGLAYVTRASAGEVDVSKQTLLLLMLNGE